MDLIVLSPHFQRFVVVIDFPEQIVEVVDVFCFPDCCCSHKLRRDICLDSENILNCFDMIGVYARFLNK